MLVVCQMYTVYIISSKNESCQETDTTNGTTDVHSLAQERRNRWAGGESSYHTGRFWTLECWKRQMERDQPSHAAWTWVTVLGDVLVFLLT